MSAWTAIEYPDAIYDETANVWIFWAKVAEVPFTAFQQQETGRPTGCEFCMTHTACTPPIGREPRVGAVSSHR